MRNRDITKDEINGITQKCPPREKAFFTVMRQSGLPPHTIKQLKIEDLERILDPDTPIPCKIDIPYEKSRTFIGEEATKYLKQYLAIRTTKLTPESLLFTIKNDPNKEINTKDVSRAFRLAAQKLEKEKGITYKVEKGKPSELRLYSLIRFYRKNAKLYLTELHNDSTPKDDEYYRKLYEEKAMLFLEIEPPTSIETRQLKKENKELRKIIEKMQETIEDHSQILYQEMVQLRSLRPEDRAKFLRLTPEAYKKIRIDYFKTNKKPSELLRQERERFTEEAEKLTSVEEIHKKFPEEIEKIRKERLKNKKS
jgi:hypothetical protein